MPAAPPLFVFTEPEKVLIRKFCGYPAYGGNPMPNFGFRYFGSYGDIEFRMNNLAIAEGLEVRNNFLPKLVQLELDIYNVRDNSDTAQAAVWYRNPKELRERRENYWGWRRLLCDFIGCWYGPQLMKAYQVRVAV